MVNSENDTRHFTATLRPDGLWEYRFTDVTRAAMDAWFEVTTRHDREYAERGDHLLRLIIIDRLIMPTPYAINRTREAAEATPPTLVESNALVLTQSVTLRLIMLVAQKLPGAAETVKVFIREDEALKWLKIRANELGGTQDA
jgi:hypothetical protein